MVYHLLMSILSHTNVYCCNLITSKKKRKKNARQIRYLNICLEKWIIVHLYYKENYSCVINYYYHISCVIIIIHIIINYYYFSISPLYNKFHMMIRCNHSNYLKPRSRRYNRYLNIFVLF